MQNKYQNVPSLFLENDKAKKNSKIQENSEYRKKIRSALFAINGWSGSDMLEILQQGWRTYGTRASCGTPQIFSGTPLDTFVELLFSSLKIANHKKFKNHRVG